MNVSASVLKPLHSVYHSALRFITGDNFPKHHCLLYRFVGWDSLTTIRDQHWLLFVYIAILQRLPRYLSSCINSQPIHFQTCSLDWLVLEVLRVSTDLGKCNYIDNSPSSFNDLQATLKLNSLVSVGHFRSILREIKYYSCACLD